VEALSIFAINFWQRFVCGFAWNGFSRGLADDDAFYWRRWDNQNNHGSQGQNVGDPIKDLAQFILVKIFILLSLK
jgi:hypothetical protein